MGLGGFLVSQNRTLVAEPILCFREALARIGGAVVPFHGKFRDSCTGELGVQVPADWTELVQLAIAQARDAVQLDFELGNLLTVDCKAS